MPRHFLPGFSLLISDFTEGLHGLRRRIRHDVTRHRREKSHFINAPRSSAIRNNSNHMMIAGIEMIGDNETGWRPAYD